MSQKEVITPEINLEEALYIRVEGEIGKFNTLPWEVLKKIGDSLQELIQAIAIIDIDATQAIDLKNFRIEMDGFYKGSAIPAFKLTPRIQAVIGDVQEQRKVLNRKFESLMELANEGSYLKLTERYSYGVARNQIAEKLYKFATSAGNSPLSIVVPSKGSYTNIYEVKKFSKEAKDALVDHLIKLKAKSDDNGKQTAIARVDVKRSGTKTKNKIVELYTNESIVPSYSPKILVYDSREYILYNPLSSAIIKDGDTILVENEMLGLVGAGRNESEAEEDFAREFDFIYQRYLSMDDSELSSRLVRIKSILKNIVKQVNQK